MRIMGYSSEKDKIQSFIERKMIKKLMNDQKQYKIVSEGDLQSCVYFHLRRFFKSRNLDKWYVLNKLSMGKKEKSKKFPDIVIVYMEKKGKKSFPAFLIELKETINFKEKTAKDAIKKLEKLIKKYKRNLYQAFLFYACRDRRGDMKVNLTNALMEEMISKK